MNRSGKGYIGEIYEAMLSIKENVLNIHVSDLTFINIEEREKNSKHV
jgi:hypothetical protein